MEKQIKKLLDEWAELDSKRSEKTIEIFNALMTGNVRVKAPIGVQTSIDFKDKPVQNVQNTQNAQDVYMFKIEHLNTGTKRNCRDICIHFTRTGGYLNQKTCKDIGFQPMSVSKYDDGELIFLKGKIGKYRVRLNGYGACIRGKAMEGLKKELGITSEEFTLHLEGVGDNIFKYNIINK